MPWLVVTAGVAALAAADARAIAVGLLIFLSAAAWRWPRQVLGCVTFTVLAVRPALDVLGAGRTGLVNLSFNAAVAVGLAILWTTTVLALRRGREGRPLFVRREVWSIHLWLVAAYGIGFVSGVHLYGWEGLVNGGREVIRIASILAGFLAVMWWVAEEEGGRKRAWRWLFVGLGAPVTVAIWQYFSGTGNLETEGLNRLQGTLSHPNSFGIFLVPYILLLLSGIGTLRGGRRLLRLAGAAGLTLLLVLSYSRTALLVLATGVLVLPLLQARRFGWVGLRRGLVLTVLVITLGWVLAGPAIQNRFADITSASFSRSAWEDATVGVSENSLEWRLLNWAILLQTGRNHPWLGHGAGMTTVLNPLISPFNNLPFNAHSDYVRFFFEAGIIGLLCYLVYSWRLCLWGLRCARAAMPVDAPQAFAAAAALLAFLFLSFGTTEVSLNTAVLYELYGVLALVATPNSQRLVWQGEVEILQRARPAADR